MSDDLVPEDLVVDGMPLIRAGMSFLMPRPVEKTPEERFLAWAQGTLFAAQARREAVHAAREERAALADAPVPLWDLLPGRFDLVVVGSRGSGKSRSMAKLIAGYKAADGHVEVCVATWPDWNTVRNCLLAVDEAGALMEAADGEAPKPLLRALNFARHLEVSTVLVAQTVNQVPPAILRLGVGLLVTGAPWDWRAMARKELVDRLDAAAAVMSAGRSYDRSAVAYVDGDGVAHAVTL